eukprot:TRINITY_DN5523_c0_g1_i6.p1 TRINITY_DN5523_c0_g1~~TRINITY_DN5523_c0_g1_i6.p1  ORF type:complete len:459 (-),score=102.90 TRINITY_DN5523_c0_g1_i6:151-1527(-)
MKWERKIQTSQAQEWADRHKIMFQEVSAKTGENVNLAFHSILRKIVANPTLRVTIKEHEWKKHTFTKPTACRICNRAIWGIFKREGLKCSDCGYPRHKGCLVVGPCGKETHPRLPRRQSVQDLISSVTEELTEILRERESRDLLEKFMENSKKDVGKKLISFWCSVEEYRSYGNLQLRKEFGKRLHNSVILKGKPLFELNLSEKTIKDLKKRISGHDWHLDLFDRAQTDIYLQIRDQYYPDFVKAEFGKTYQGSGVLMTPQERKAYLIQVRADPDLLQFFDSELEAPLIDAPLTHREDRAMTVVTPSHLRSLSEGEVLPRQRSPSLSHRMTHSPRPRFESRGSQDEDFPTFALSNDWFFGKMDRSKTQEMLQSSGHKTFLIRESSIAGCYALSMYNVDRDGFIHFVIEKTPDSRYWIRDCPLDDRNYQNLSQLVAMTPTLQGYIPLRRVLPVPQERVQ